MHTPSDSSIFDSIISLDDIYHDAPCGYVSLLPDGTIIKANKTFLDWMGFNNDEVILKMKFSDFLSKGGAIHYEMFFMPMIRIDGRVSELSYEVVKKDQTKMPCLINAKSFVDNTGNIIAINVSIFDITERKRYEQQLLAAKRLAEAASARKDEFIGIASHELKTPITSLKAYIQILELMELPEAAKSFVSRGALSINIMEFLISNLLDISVINSGNLELSKSKFPLKTVLHQCAEIVGHSYSSHTILVESEDSRDYIVFADRQRIMQVMINLIANAIKYSPGQNKVKVVISNDSAAGIVTVNVLDFGIGISADDLEKVFQKYYRVDKPLSSQNIHGLGLGLYIIQTIMRLHGSKIFVESEVDKGSKFYFSLPYE